MKKEKKIKKIFLNSIFLIIIISVLYNIAFSISTTISQNDNFKTMGISLFNMKTELMQNDINYGDFVVVKEVKEKDLQEGDIIAYTVNGKTRINKIIKKQQDNYTTKSNKNYYPDIEKITYNEIIGKKIFNIKGLGFVVEILQSQITTGFILICFILYFLYNKYLFSKKEERARKKNSMR